MCRRLWSIWNDGESLHTVKVAFIYPAGIARMFTVILLLRKSGGRVGILPDTGNLFAPSMPPQLGSRS